MVLAGPAGPESYIQPELPSVPTPEAATFVVSYSGFPAAARTAFQRAVNIWAGQLTSPVPITVSATFTPLGSGVLGSAGPGALWRNFANAPRSNTWFAEAIANKRAGRQLSSTPDVVARFSSSYSNWHFGSGPAPAGKFDFTTVVLHELGHGLGFVGFGRVSGSLGAIRAAGSPLIYDAYVENTAGSAMLGFADPSAALATQFRSNGLWFDSSRVRAANGNLRARLYAPSTFLPGSSYSHLDESSYPRGNANSLMTPFIGTAETVRSPGPITLAIFRTSGW